MTARDPRCRLGPYSLLMLAIGIPCWVAGCGGGESSKPAPVGAEQGKQVQKYMANYRDQMIAENKAKAKEKAAEKKSP